MSLSVSRNLLTPIPTAVNAPVAMPPPPKEPLLDRMAKKLMPFGLELMVARRMQAYDGPVFASFRGAALMFEVMEQTGASNDPGSFLSVFEGTLVKMLADPKVDAFIGRIEAGEASQDVWAMAVEQFGGEREALHVMAALFQDSSGLGGHVMRILSKPELSAVHAKAQRLGTLCQRYAASAMSAKLLPERFRDAPDIRAYHFLVMAEAAARMREQGIAPRVAALAPYSLNTAYEIYQKRYEKDGVDGISILMQDPLRAGVEAIAPSDPKLFAPTDGPALSDVYMGYAGAAFGAGLADTAQPYAQFASSFAADSRAAGEAAFK